MTIQQQYDAAISHHQAGRLADAGGVFRQVLALRPNHAGALHMLGVIEHQMGRHAEAARLIERAISIEPNSPNFHSNFGIVLTAQGRLEDAIAAYERAIELRPDFAEAHNNLGTALKDKSEWDNAIAAFRRAVALRPNYAEALSNLGNALREKGLLPESIASLRQALALRPHSAEIRNNLGNALRDAGQLEQAIVEYRQAVSLRPNFADAYNNLGLAFRFSGTLDEAIAAFRAALALRPDYVEALNNLGNSLGEAGDLDEALACYRQAASIKPDARVAGNLLYSLHFHPDYDAARIWQEHVRWNQAYARQLANPTAPFENIAISDRRLRVGYVSPDFREHPVGRFMLPLMEHHDHCQFEIFAYSDVRRPDVVTERLRRRAGMWRSTLGISDEQLARLIRQDHVDILVDLTMHMEGTRMLTFARKPAPVQVTYLAYCSTTGLETMDFRLTDRYLDPPDMDDRYYSEQSARLPASYWCYPAPEQAPNVAPLPALAAGHVTFGCLNNFAKVSPSALEAWRRLLREVPASSLILHSHDGGHRRRIRDYFVQFEIDPARIEFVGFLGASTYFAQYQRIDVALDPFPYPGGTTTCDALWMGVPVVTLGGKTAVSRAGVSILSNVGLPELISRSMGQYTQIAAQLAADLPRLAELRASLRQRMRSSPLMDARYFARAVEAAYRQMWRGWCDRQSAKSPMSVNSHSKL